MKLLYWQFVFVLLLIIASCFLFLWKPQTSTKSDKQIAQGLSLQTLQSIRAKVHVADNPILDKKVLADLYDSDRNSFAVLNARSGNFYEFGIYSKDGGGFALITLQDQSGHFEKIWAGQDDPKCAPIEKYHVDADLVPQCYDNGLVIRWKEVD